MSPLIPPAFNQLPSVQTQRSPSIKYASPATPTSGRSSLVSTFPLILNPTPAAPVAPRSPRSPFAPSSPIGPLGPVGPWGPVKPIGPCGPDISPPSTYSMPL